MTPRERLIAVVAALAIGWLACALLHPAPADPTPRTPITWCLPDSPDSGHWARDRFKPSHAVRVICVARDAITQRPLFATLAARPIDGTFSHVTGGAEPAYWDLPAGMDMVFSASTPTHFSGSGYRRVPALPGAALAMTAWLLPRPAPLTGAVSPGSRVRLLRPDPEPATWWFVDRLRASPLAAAGSEEAWAQVFGTAVVVQADGSWSHSCFAELPTIVEVESPGASGVTRARAELTPVQDLNRSPEPKLIADGAGGAVSVTAPAYPTQWSPALVSLRAARRSGRPLDATIRVRHAAGGSDSRWRRVGAGRGSLEFSVTSRAEWIVEVSAAGHHPRNFTVRLEPLDRLWIPEFVLEPAE